MRLIYLSAILFLSITTLNAQKWIPVSENQITLKNNQTREIIPDHYALMAIDFDRLKKDLSKAPLESSTQRSQNEITISVPLPNGEIHNVRAYESPVMRPLLQAKYPGIRSYRVYNKKEKISGRIAMSQLGLHAAFKTPKGTVYIDPYANNMTDHYMSYYTKDDHSQSPVAPLGCGHHGHDLENHSDWASLREAEDAGVSMRSPSEPVVLHEYDFALACTGEWGQNQGGVANIMAKFNTGVNRLNQIFEQDLSMRIILVDNNDLLAFTDPNTDPYDGNQGFNILGANTAALNNTIGINTYDFGHVWSNCNDTGGVAFGSSACTGNRGAGVTCIGTSAGVSGVMVNITAHEIGHQLSAGHTWNKCTDDLFGQFAPASAFEPGSGTTIMSYAGLCGGNSVAFANTDNYHVGTLNEMLFYTRETGAEACATKVDTDNNTPEAYIPMEGGFVIPVGTPFELTGDAFDPDGDPMTYSWEQYDLGPSSDLGTPLGTAPLFRVYYPDENAKTRVFPRMQSIISGSGPQGTEVERLPQISRDLTFRFVVRDNHEGIGAVDWEEIEFSSTDQAGPFMLTFPNIDEQFTVGDTATITWDVANTDQSPVNCEFVDIFLSDDGGFNYNYQLAKNAPNDGSHEVIIPNAVSDFVRIKVKGADNIFFDIGNLNSRVFAPTIDTYYLGLDALCGESCLPDDVSFNIESVGFNDFTESIELSVVDGLPSGAVATISPEVISAGESASVDLDMTNVAGDGTYLITIQAVAGTDTLFREYTLSTTGNDFSSLASLTPESNVTGLSGLPLFSWVNVADADSYRLQLSTSPDFENNIIDQDGLTDTTFESNAILENSTVYYWRVIATNSCGSEAATSLQAFSTEALECFDLEAIDLPKNISQSGLPTIQTQFVINSTAQLSDINIKRVKGLHERVSDLEFRMIAPDGDAVLLLDKSCGNSSNFNCGFDSESPFPLSCPLTNSTIFEPAEDLSILYGKDLLGVWTFEIKDTKSGNGGALQEVQLEICSNTVLDAPILINNNKLGVPPGQRQIVRNLELLSEDANNTAEELVYTIVTLPQHGILTRNEQPITVGSQFTQSDIDQIRIIYGHDGTATVEDSFEFTVQDGEGGWIGITTFEIEIDETFVSSTEDIDEINAIQVYPNPVRDILNVNTEFTTGSFELQIVDITGKTVYSQTTSKQKNAIDVKGLSAGTYVLIIQHDDKQYQKQIIISE